MKDIAFFIRLEQDVVDALRIAADAREQSVAVTIRQAVRQWLAREFAPKARK